MISAQTRSAFVARENRAHFSLRSCGSLYRRNISLKRSAHRSNFTGGMEITRKYAIAFSDRLRWGGARSYPSPLRGGSTERSEVGVGVTTHTVLADPHPARSGAQVRDRARHPPRTQPGFTPVAHQTFRKSGRPDLRWGGIYSHFLSLKTQ